MVCEGWRALEHLRPCQGVYEFKAIFMIILILLAIFSHSLNKCTVEFFKSFNIYDEIIPQIFTWNGFHYFPFFKKMKELIVLKFLKFWFLTWLIHYTNKSISGSSVFYWIEVLWNTHKRTIENVLAQTILQLYKGRN